MAKDAPEGWEWTLIQSRPCPQCGYQPSSKPVPALGQEAMAEAQAWADFLAGAETSFLRASPAPGTWSPAQYGAHVRDMLAVFGVRITLALAEDDPAVPWFDPGEAGWRSYNELPPSQIAADIEAKAQAFASIVEATAEPDWARTARRDGTDRFTVAGLACFGAHEAHHHLLDANGELAARLATPA